MRLRNERTANQSLSSINTCLTCGTSNSSNKKIRKDGDDVQLCADSKDDNKDKLQGDATEKDEKESKEPWWMTEERDEAVGVFDASQVDSESDVDSDEPNNIDIDAPDEIDSDSKFYDSEDERGLSSHNGESDDEHSDGWW